METERWKRREFWMLESTVSVVSGRFADGSAPVPAVRISKRTFNDLKPENYFLDHFSSDLKPMIDSLHVS
ncbi:hypothetical protein C4D60_Mb02t07160 [Musa balbisiana]|uniref:Uncharacterized protein n=1 Tax=Musa balbisiana TaxID=52838 RepID=A0A4S8I8W5_MUSBA|nr:hypothetical protein C4D60_Mb02t07160 [Musa balbisiana]